MKIYTFRLSTGQDLRKEIESFALDHQIKAGFIITCVGGLKKAVLRMAGATPTKQVIKIFNRDFEIVSLVGTVGENDSHLHISVSEKNGQTIGGHLKPGSLVAWTAEIVIGQDENSVYKRKLDPETGFEELSVE